MLNAAFNTCLRTGVFPERWKRARLALLAKPGEPEGVPSSYRPLCLLDDVGKMLETLLVNRMLEFMADSGIELSEPQFGFRRGLSTDDASRAIRERLVSVCDARRWAVAVSLDIRNAFNFLGWEVIHEALESMGFLPYIRRILRSYLGGRVLHLCEDDRGIPVTMEATCGVPQGSVFGPLLWNVAYDVVFRLPMPRGTATIVYADDTLVVVEGDSVDAMEERANAALETVADAIRGLGLCLAVEKTQVVVFTRRYGAVDPLILLRGRPYGRECP